MSGRLPSIQPPRPQSPGLGLAYTTSANYESSSAQSTISPQTPSSAGGQNMSLLGPQIAGRPDIDGRHHYPQPVQVSSLENVHRYAREFDHLAGHHSLQESFAVTRPMAGSQGAPAPHPGGPLTAHKRAYRQRRKDPSCDACRERKVKCDATDTSSCSECSSRNVKCQFTKETNRRMSSIKQVQDLEKQLHLARQQVSQLRSIVKTDPFAIDEEDVATAQSPNKRRKLTNASNMSAIQLNMETQGQGLINGPMFSESSNETPAPGSTMPQIPLRQQAEYLLDNYVNLLHGYFPFVDIGSIRRHLDLLYETRTIANLPADTNALLFGILACGTLRDDPRQGEGYFESAKSLIQLWIEKPSVDMVRTALLLFIYLVETNRLSAGFTIMGFIVRAAQDMGLHYKSSSRNETQEQLRHKLWWSILCMERCISFELGRPSMINDEDYEVLEEDNWTDQNVERSIPDQFEFMIKISRIIPHVQKAFRAPVVSPGMLSTVDEQIKGYISQLQPHHQIPSSEHAQFVLGSPAIFLQNARLLLHRHNLSPASLTDTKATAVDQCVSISQETARLFSRLMREDSHSSGQPASWRRAVRVGSGTFCCMHLFRCALFLAGSGDFEGALICAQVCAEIGDHRAVNISCGRYFAFVLGVVLVKFQRGLGSLGDDDELLAYVSADLQSNLNQSWIWQNFSQGSPPNFDQSANKEVEKGGQQDPDKDSWDGAVKTLSRLVEDQRQRQPQPSAQPPQQPGSAGQESSSGGFLAPKNESTASPTPAVSPGGSTNRMSIADLI